MTVYNHVHVCRYKDKKSAFIQPGVHASNWTRKISALEKTVAFSKQNDREGKIQRQCTLQLLMEDSLECH